MFAPLAWRLLLINVQVNATGQSLVENPSNFPPEYMKTEEFKQRMKEISADRTLSQRLEHLAFHARLGSSTTPLPRIESSPSMTMALAWVSRYMLS